MSATNRSTSGPGRISGDFYGTPPAYVRALLPELFPGGPPPLYPGMDRAPGGPHIHDPCTGTGAILRTFLDHGFRPEGLSGGEIDPVLRLFCTMETGIVPALGDYLAGPPPNPNSGPDLIVTNPPYSLALPFAERALAHIRPGGIVAFFLRLGFLASLERSEFHRRHPARVLICNPRPSFARFLKKGKLTTTDASEYAWFVWGGPREWAGTWAHLDCRNETIRPRLERVGFEVPEVWNDPEPPTIRDGDPPVFALTP